jgi:DNA-binding transcriptional ArsR family regulator
MVAESVELDRVFHALAHPARRDMLARLSEGERNLTELAAPLEMSFPAASKHVRVLEAAHLVSRRVEGRSHYCRIEARPMAEAVGWMQAFRNAWEPNFRRLDALLDTMNTPPHTPLHDAGDH